MLAPVGGRDDFSVLFHEAGHAEHYAHVDPALPFEFRYLGDNAITEAFAFLFEHLIEDPEWLRAGWASRTPTQLPPTRARTRLIYLRRYAAKLAYELELHGAPHGRSGTTLRASATRSCSASALRIDWPAQTYLADVDPGFYCACYLRAWALETHLRAHLRERFGGVVRAARGRRRAARLWREGQRLGAEELLGELTGAQLDFGVLLDDLGLADA